MRRLENGVMNPYESINVIISRLDLSIVCLNRFNKEINTLSPEISEEVALESAKELTASLGGSITNTTLCYTLPNYYWSAKKTPKKNNVRLAYKFSINKDAFIIHVDAITGEIIGGDRSKSDSAGVYSSRWQDGRDGYLWTNQATAGMKALGYNPVDHYVSTSNNTMRSRILNYMNQNDAYGLYFTGHGSSNTTDPRITVEKHSGLPDIDYVLYSSEVKGNWHFVFIDACYSGRAIWAEAFNITNTHKDRAYLGWSSSIYFNDSLEFGYQFWPLVGKMSIRDAAVKAANEVPGSGTTPIRFYGDSSYDGKAWN